MWLNECNRISILKRWNTLVGQVFVCEIEEKVLFVILHFCVHIILHDAYLCFCFFKNADAHNPFDTNPVCVHRTTLTAA